MKSNRILNNPTRFRMNRTDIRLNLMKSIQDSTGIHGIGPDLMESHVFGPGFGGMSWNRTRIRWNPMESDRISIAFHEAGPKSDESHGIKSGFDGIS